MRFATSCNLLASGQNARSADETRRTALLLPDQPVARDLRRQLDAPDPQGHDVRRQTSLPRDAPVRRAHLLEHLQAIGEDIRGDALVEHGILTKTDDETHKQKAVYSLTEKGIALLPIIVQIGAWGSHHVPASKKLDARSRAIVRGIQDGGPSTWNRMMSDLRKAHLGR